ncbi:DegT/DnrJ/EryC1/StrS family aminotransferase [soil metagenome]
MQPDFLPFTKPSISKEAIAEVVACLESGWIATGPRVQRFEAELKTYLQAPHVLALMSATAGLQLALQALELKAGDEVITTPLTFVASLNTIVQAGAKPVLVDIDPRTYNLDIEQVAAAITPRTKAIMPVHFAGLPVDLDALYALAVEHELRVIEDAAHAIGTKYKDRLIGSFGDTQVFSFHPNKNMTTGEGGCIATRDDNLAKKITTLRFHGIDRDAFNRFSKQGSQEYDVIVPGYKYNMMDIQAALGLHQLPELDGFIERRTTLANRYQTLLADWSEWSLPGKPAYSHRHAWHLYTPVLKTEVAGVDRAEFMQKMKEQDIGTGLHFQAAHLFHYYQKQFGYKLGDFPRAEYVCERIVSLPLFPDMTENDQDRVIAAMKKIFS